MKNYAIWNKQDNILTPIGEVLTPEKWIERYPIAGIESITVVCAAGEINGGFFGTLGEMVRIAEAQGADFSKCTTDEEKLAVIEALEEQKLAEAKAKAEEAAQQQALDSESLASIAASMEYQNMMTLDDVEV